MQYTALLNADGIPVSELVPAGTTMKVESGGVVTAVGWFDDQRRLIYWIATEGVLCAGTDVVPEPHRISVDKH